MKPHINCPCTRCILANGKRCEKHGRCVAKDGHVGQCQTARKWPGLLVRVVLEGLRGAK